MKLSRLLGAGIILTLGATYWMKQSTEPAPQSASEPTEQKAPANEQETVRQMAQFLEVNPGLSRHASGMANQTRLIPTNVYDDYEKPEDSMHPDFLLPGTQNMVIYVDTVEKTLAQEPQADKRLEYLNREFSTQINMYYKSFLTRQIQKENEKNGQAVVDRAPAAEPEAPAQVDEANP